jgi:Uma2 family endonuclease
MTATSTRKISLAKYAAMPETTQPQAIVNAELIVRPSPLPVHQRRVRRIARLKEELVEAVGDGELFISPLDVLIRDDPLTYRQPDIFVVSCEELERHPGYETTVPMRARPYLVLEVLSPGNYPQQMADRLADYASIGVEEVWLASLADETVKVLRLEEGEYTRVGLYHREEPIQSPRLPQMRRTAAELFR